MLVFFLAEVMTFLIEFCIERMSFCDWVPRPVSAPSSAISLYAPVISVGALSK